MFDIISIGDATFDTFIIIDDGCKQCRVNTKSKQLCINYADKVCIEHINQSIGGNASNLAVGAKKLGLHSTIVTELGDDINGLAIQHDLTNAGIDMSLTKIHKNRQTRFSVVLNYRSERTILSYHAKRKYTLPKLPKTKWVYYTSLGTSFEPLQKKLVTYLKKNPKTKLAINPGSYQMQSGLSSIRGILSQTDILFVNKEEAQKLVEKKEVPTKLLVSLHKKGVSIVVITDGTNGSYMYDGENKYMLKPFEIKAKAKTGAGDAYASGFLAAIIYKKTPVVAMQWGTANAAGVIQKIGAHRGLLSKTAVNKMIKKYAHISPKKI
jgi:ribokinase